MNKQRGMNLIEVIVFIVVVSITVAGTMLAFNTVLMNSNQPGQISMATQLAHARMNIIEQQALVNGFTNIMDPCSAGAPPNACSELATFASNHGFTVASTISAPGGGVRTATVNVTGNGGATVSMRFVQ